MSIFLNLDQTDPYDTFAVVMRRSRLAMERTYEAAFAAHRRCAELLDSHLMHKLNVGDPLGFPVFGVPEGVAAGTAEPRRAGRHVAGRNR